MIFLIAWILYSMPDVTLRVPETGILPVWFLSGLAFGLIGDAFLMRPDRFFLPGLLAFLLNQLSYLVGFGTLYSPGANPVLQYGLYAASAVIVSIVAILLFRGMDRQGSTRMKLPVGVYAVIITLMVVAAVETFFLGWPFAASAFVGIGAVSFYVSDIMNAWSRFVGDIRYGRLKIMSTYHLAQIFITVGNVLGASAPK